MSGVLLYVFPPIVRAIYAKGIRPHYRAHRYVQLHTPCKSGMQKLFISLCYDLIHLNEKCVYFVNIFSIIIYHNCAHVCLSIRLFVCVHTPTHTTGTYCAHAHFAQNGLLYTLNDPKKGTLRHYNKSKIKCGRQMDTTLPMCKCVPLFLGLCTCP